MVLLFMWQILIFKSQILNVQSITILSEGEGVDVGQMDDPPTSEKTLKTERNNKN